MRLLSVVQIFSLLLLAAMAAVCVTPLSSQVPASEPAAPAAPKPAAQPAVAQGEPLIAGGDLLSIRVFNVADLTQDIRVNSSGDISLPLIGTVHIEGLSAAQAEQLLASELKEGGFVREPSVSVFVKEYSTQGITVMGEVQRPGIYPLLGARRLFDAVSAAGGTTQRAGKTISIAPRNDPGKPRTVEFSNDPSLNARGNVNLQPGDTVIVSKAGMVYVMGEVGRPAGIVLENNDHITILQALAVAGGVTPLAKSDKSRILRKNAAGEMVEIPIPLKDILSAKLHDQNLLPEDVLFVPRSAAKSAIRRGAEAALQTATGLAVYRF